MNSYVLVTVLMICLTWMTSVMEHQQYHRLTTYALRKTTEDEYLREGLRAYGLAYYQHYQKSLSLPATISPPHYLTQGKDVHIFLKEEQGIIKVELSQ